MEKEKKANENKDNLEILLKELEMEKDYYNNEHDRAKVIDNKANVIFGFSLGVLGLGLVNGNFQISFDKEGTMTIYNSLSLLIILSFAFIVIWFLKIFTTKEYYEMSTEKEENTDNLTKYLENVLKVYRNINNSNCEINNKKIKDLYKLNITFIIMTITILILKIINM